LGVFFLDYKSSLEDPPSNAPPLSFGLHVSSGCSIESGKVYQNRTFYFSAQSFHDLDGWLTVLRNASVEYSMGSSLEQRRLSAIQISRPMSSHSFNEEGKLQAREPSLTLKSTSSSCDSSSSGMFNHHNRNVKNNKTPDFLSATVDNELLASEKNSQTLYSVFLDVYRHISEYQGFIQTTLDAFGASAAGATNYLQPATDMIRSVRHLLYFADGRFTKTMENTDYTACLGRQMSVIIERSRKIGYHAKYLTEEECMGFRNSATIQELMEHSEELQSEVHSFVTLAKTLTDTDSILSRKDFLCTYCPSQTAFRSTLEGLFCSARSMAQAINNINIKECMEISEDLMRLASTIQRISAQHLQQVSLQELKNSMPGDVRIFALTEPELLTITSSLEETARALREAMYSNEVEPTSQTQIYVNEKFFSLHLSCTRVLITLAFYFWNHPDSSDLETICQQLGRVHLDPLDTAIRFDSGCASPESPFDIISNLSDACDGLSINTAFNCNTSNAPESEVSPRCSIILTSAPDYDLPVPESRPPAFSTCSQYGFSVNQAVAQSSFELLTIILDTSAALASFLRGLPKSASNNGTIEKTVQLAMTVITAANQMEEEIGNFEADNLPQAMVEKLDDAQQQMSRVVSTFEMSIRQLTSFFAPSDAGLRVAQAADTVHQASIAVSDALHDILKYQADGTLSSERENETSPPTPPQTPLSSLASVDSNEPKVFNQLRMIIDSHARRMRNASSMNCWKRNVWYSKVTPTLSFELPVKKAKICKCVEEQSKNWWRS
jgi:hypothetical protein